MREDAALEVGAKRLLDVVGKPPIVGLAGVREEGLQVIAHDGIEHGLRRTMQHVAGWQRAAWIGDVPGGGLFQSTCRAPRQHGRGAMAISVPCAGARISTTCDGFALAARILRHGAARWLAGGDVLTWGSGPLLVAGTPLTGGVLGVLDAQRKKGLARSSVTPLASFRPARPLHSALSEGTI